MKKTIVLLALLCAGSTGLQAQNWLESLKRGATAAVDEATDGKLTAAAICGDWSYARPGVKLEGSDAVASASAPMLETAAQEKLAPIYAKAGIEAGDCLFAFDGDGSYRATLGSRSSNGHYEFDPKTHRITLTPDGGGSASKPVAGYAFVSGENLQLLFAADKLVELVAGVGAQLPSLQNTVALLEKFDRVYLGFEFSK